jgi:DNA (cytosine-5)-methyltransferase 1
MRTVRAVDLFCGGGGTSQGLVQACEAAGASVDLVAVNHWERAVETHAANHPHARHYCARIDSLDPREVCPRGLDLLVASPECTHHSRARGGKPKNDQSRASGWDVLRWCELLLPRAVLLENVVEWQDWGPLGSDGQALKSRKGETFAAFLGGLVSLGYRVEWRVLNAADYGDATTRRRLFVQARRGRTPIVWPTPSHAEESGGMFPVPRWRAAREVIDWGLPSRSVFTRERPLAENTMRRIAEGLRRYAGPQFAEAFLLHLTHGGRTHGTDAPLPTVTGANRGEIGLVQPFIVPHYSENGNQRPRVHSVEAPMPTLPATVQHGVCQPYLVHLKGTGTARNLASPVPSLQAGGEHVGLAQPFLLSQDGRGALRAVSDPSPTIVSKGAVSLVEPFLVSFYGNGHAHPVSRPVPTTTTKDRFGLVEPARLDVLFRMLQPHELAAAMGFPTGYRFTGNRGEVIRQIGNAVAVNVARALCTSALALEAA